MTIAPEQAAALSEHLLGRKPVGGWQCKPFGAGRFSETFAIDNGHNERYVLRVAPPDSLLQLFYERRMMRREPAIHQRLRSETNVPVPEITAYDFSRRQIDRDYLIMPRLDGEPLSAAGLDAAGQRRALREWGSYVAQIHNLTDSRDRYGYLGAPSCMEPQPTWADAFDDMFRRELDDIKATGVYDRATANLALDLLRQHREVFESCCDASRLLHGDLWVTNLLVAPDGRVTGVIDFDRACWGDIEWDLAIAEYCGVTQPAFWEGYGRKVDSRHGAAAVRRFFYLLYEHQKYIVISMSARRKDPRGAQRYAAECKKAMESFRDTGQPAF